MRPRSACAQSPDDSAPGDRSRATAALHFASRSQISTVSAEDPVFFDEVCHGWPLPLVEPADQRCEEPAEERRVEHGGKSIPRPDLAVLEDPQPSNETLRGSPSQTETLRNAQESAIRHVQGRATNEFDCPNGRKLLL